MNGNTITIVGNLTKDPILKYLPTGKAVTNLSVACNHGWRDKETQAWVEGETSFFKVECWEPMAENIAESLRKGDPVIVVGRMSCRKYEQEGQTRASWEIRAETVGPDMRKRAASLRRVLRHSQTSEGQETPDVAAEATEPDEKQDGERLQPAVDFAVAS